MIKEKLVSNTNSQVCLPVVSLSVDTKNNRQKTTDVDVLNLALVLIMLRSFR